MCSVLCTVPPVRAAYTWRHAAAGSGGDGEGRSRQRSSLSPVESLSPSQSHLLLPFRIRYPELPLRICRARCSMKVLCIPLVRPIARVKRLSATCRMRERIWLTRSVVGGLCTGRPHKATIQLENVVRNGYCRNEDEPAGKLRPRYRRRANVISVKRTLSFSCGLGDMTGCKPDTNVFANAAC